jgi:putative zinc finger/helix-turn-helix YgiT family protein
MICTNCFEEEYKTSKTELTISVNGESHVLHDLECETCPACGEVTFTHAQSLEIDKKRIALEFGAKPLLTPEQMKILRRFLGLKLDEICDLLHIGRNSYGRWERGEVAITPSMNLLVHNLIEKVPDAAVNVLETVRVPVVERANAGLLGSYISFGEYLREVIAAAKLMPEVVCLSIGMEHGELVRIENNDLQPEKIPCELTAKIALYFRIPLDALTRLLNEALKVLTMKSAVSAVHARSTCYDAKGAGIQASSVNKILEKLAQKKGAEQSQQRVSDDYLARVKTALEKLQGAEG